MAISCRRHCPFQRPGNRHPTPMCCFGNGKYEETTPRKKNPGKTGTKKKIPAWDYGRNPGIARLYEFRGRIVCSHPLHHLEVFRKVQKVKAISSQMDPKEMCRLGVKCYGFVVRV
ncbi:hypothetical protein NPIL_240871 [Nephila pilipes]|uniref:Uncharacterized protein n=1 Tax=Nephila pilipes TaxID=299642 RepID=A0A8X6JWN0_NEPPI|nr:hypothetical protein NPIL_240871 [Nephila pilipes]